MRNGAEFQRAFDLFEELCVLPRERWGAELDSRSLDRTLRSEVEALLEEDARREESDGATAQIQEGVVESLENLDQLTVLPQGTKVGRYTILQPIGEGGFGTVYMAQQERPVQRRVALKVIKLGMDTKEVIARFEAERQALAMMDHPNIAKVLDGGATDSGRPYFVMDLVQGVPITTYCDANSLSTSQRLELFIPVCQAVQHAHQKGIIHRDLKPSNILVSMHEGRPIARIIDFGIAKAINQRLTQHTMCTQLGQLVGTPAYMSPEQAEMSALDVDTRADVYSLGAMLYELLTGVTPIAQETLESASPFEIQQLIRDAEPARPSIRFSKLDGDSRELAELRADEPVHLVRRLRGDLDWIVMKCLEKDRTRRYETANALANDLQRYLDDEPVLATPPSQIYKLRKAIRRNRGAFAAGIAIALVLVLGVAGTTAGLVQAQQEAEHARLEAAKSDEVARLMTEMIESVNPFVADKRDTTLLREILEETERRLDQNPPEFPEVEVRLRTTIGAAYTMIDLRERATSNLRRGVSLLRAVGNDSDDLLAETLLALGQSIWFSDVDEAEQLICEALVHRQEHLRPDDRRIAEARRALLTVLHWQSYDPAKREEAARCALDVMEFFRRVHGDRHEETALAKTHYGTALSALGRHDEAIALHQEAIRTHERLRGDIMVGGATIALAMAYLSAGQYEIAESTARRAVELRRRTMGKVHMNIAAALSSHGHTLMQLGRASEARGNYEEALAMIERIPGHGRKDVSRVVVYLAEAQLALGRTEDAISSCRQALRLDALDQTLHLAILGRARMESGQLVEAEATLRESVLTGQKKRDPRDIQTIRARCYHGECLRRTGRLDEAESELAAAYDILIAQLPERSRHIRYAMRALTELYTTLDAERPGEGYDTKATDWRARLEAIEATFER